MEREKIDTLEDLDALIARVSEAQNFMPHFRVKKWMPFLRPPQRLPTKCALNLRKWQLMKQKWA